MRPFRVACCSVALVAAAALIFDLLARRWTWALLELAIVIIAVQAMHIDTYRQFFRDLSRLKLPTTTAEAELRAARQVIDATRAITGEVICSVCWEEDAADSDDDSCECSCHGKDTAINQALAAYDKASR